MTAVDIIAMPVSDRLRLMETLWDSLCGQNADTMEFPAWHGEVLAERMRRLSSGEDTASPWVEAKERIRAQTKSV